MSDLLFLGIPAVGGIILLIASLIKWGQTQNIWFTAPALFGLLAGGNILGVLDSTTSLDGSMSWVFAVFFLLLGLIFYRIASQRTKTTVS